MHGWQFTSRQGGRSRLVSVLVISAAMFTGSAKAAIIFSHIGPAASSFSNSTSPRAFGQSFTTPVATGPAGSGWNSITVNFYSNSTSTSPEATGDLYLLTAPYTGSPAALSSSTPGFVAEATTITGGSHVFASSVSLLGGTQYFIYEDALTPTGGVYADTSGSGGQTLAYAGTSNTPFVAAPGYEMNFLVQGAVPEPATVALGIAAPALLLRRRRNR